MRNRTRPISGGVPIGRARVRRAFRRKEFSQSEARQGLVSAARRFQAFLDEKSSVSESLPRLKSAWSRKEASNLEGESDDVIEQQPRLFRDVPRLEARPLDLQMVF